MRGAVLLMHGGASHSLLHLLLHDYYAYKEVKLFPRHITTAPPEESALANAQTCVKSKLIGGSLTLRETAPGHAPGPAIWFSPPSRVRRGVSMCALFTQVLVSDLGSTKVIRAPVSAKKSIVLGTSFKKPVPRSDISTGRLGVAAAGRGDDVFECAPPRNGRDREHTAVGDG